MPQMRVTPSPAQQQIARVQALRDAQVQELYIRPTNIPYRFTATAALPDEGGAPAALPVDLSQMVFWFRNSSGFDAASRVKVDGPARNAIVHSGPCVTYHQFQMGIAIDPRGLPAGMYALHGHAPIAPFTLPDGDVVVGATARMLQGERIYIPANAGASPDAQAARAFLVLPGDDTTYTGANGAQVQRRAIALRTATVTGARDGRETVAVDGFSEPIVADAVKRDGLLPLLDDATVQELNQRYDGKTVWGRGGLSFQCVSDSAGMGFAGGSTRTPYRILHVYRVLRPGTLLAIGNQVGAGGGDRRSAFDDEEPLVVVLDVPPKADLEYAETWSNAASSVSAGHAGADGRAHCAGYYSYFADAWDFERAYSLQPPPFHAESIAKGMTHEQVAWILGYPAELGTPDELDTLPVWRYDNLPPFNYWVYFDANGRVTAFGPDGDLP